MKYTLKWLQHWQDKQRKHAVRTMELFIKTPLSQYRNRVSDWVISQDLETRISVDEGNREIRESALSRAYNQAKLEQKLSWYETCNFQLLLQAVETLWARKTLHMEPELPPELPPDDTPHVPSFREIYGP